jgi:MFS family permease
MEIPAPASESVPPLPAPVPPVPDAVPVRWRPGTFRSLRHRNYRLYFIGQVISLTGTWMQNTALSWLAFHITGLSRWTALIMAAQLVPLLVLGGWGGALADRLPKRNIIFATQSVMLVLALLLAGLVLADRADPWNLLAIALANGIAGAIDLPARLAFVMDMVGRDDLTNAVALNSMMFNAARVAGPALGALAYGALGPAQCFLLNSLSYVAVLIALAMMDVDGRTANKPGQRRSSLGAGVRFLTRHGQLLLLLVLSCAMSLFGWPTLTLLPALVKLQLHALEGVYGALLSTVGGGAFVAAALVATFSSRGWQKLFLAAGVALTGASLAGLSLANDTWSAAACCTFLGMGLILFFPTGQAIMQLSAGDDNRGVIMGIWAMVMGGSVPLGGLLAGEAADRWGVSAVLATEALGIAVAAAGVLVAASVWRRAKPLPEPADGG